MKRKFLYSESRLAEVTGLSRAQLKKSRVKGEWRKGKGKGGPVELSERGVQKVLERFGIQEVDLDGARLGSRDGTQRSLNQLAPPVTLKNPLPNPPILSTASTIEGFPCRWCGRDAFRDPKNLEPWHAKQFCNQECMELGEKNPDRAFQAIPDLKLLKVSQLPPNKRILRAQNGTGEVYQVIVPSSLVWAIGDPLRAKVSEKHQGYFELVGKAPRWRGDRIYRHEFV
jgi:hypothetical protein